MPPTNHRVRRSLLAELAAFGIAVLIYPGVVWVYRSERGQR